MLLHLVRHAHAVEETEHRARPLSARGRAEAARLARFFAGNGCFVPAHVWHSPLLRSRETTDELARRLAWSDTTVVVETSGLLPEDDPREVAERLEIWPRDRGDLAIIGHEPHLSALASLLVRGREKPVLFAMKKAAVLTLEPTSGVFKKTGFGRWRVRWLVAPELLPATTLPLALAAQSPQTLPPA